VSFDLSVDSPAAGAARLRLKGHLDDAGARDVLRAAADAVACGCSRLVVDLGGLSSFDDDAAYAVRGCTRLARWLPEGVAVLAEDGAGERLADRAGVVAEHTCTGPAGSMATCPAC
jgi:hypothetical protein